MDNGVEIEAKFTLPDAGAAARFRQLERLADYTLSPGEEKHFHDCFLDTADRRITVARYMLRRREQRAVTVMTLKGPGRVSGAVHRRAEWKVTLSPARPAESWRESPLHARLAELTGGAPLRLLFCIRQRRLFRPLHREGRTVAELTVDEVTVGAGEAMQTYFELEIELAEDGTAADLETLSACLQTEYGLQPQPRSKFERTLALLGDRPPIEPLLTIPERAALLPLSVDAAPRYRRRALALLALDEGASTRQAGERAGLSPRRVRHWRSRFLQRRLDIFPPALFAAPEAAPPAPAEVRPPEPAPPLPAAPGLTPDDTMAEAAVKILRLHFRRMVHHEAGTRQGEDIETLHDMRVATRRMRAALRVFGDHLNMKPLRPFRKGLRRTARALGRVRDLDVFWEKTQHFLENAPEGTEVNLEPLRAVWAAEHEKGRRKLLAYLDSPAYQKFKTRFDEFLQDPAACALPPFTGAGFPRPRRLRHIAPLALYRRWAAVQAYDEWIARAELSPEQLHQLRIECKQLRYTLEFFREVLGPEAKSLIKQIKALQNHLGDLQDAVVASGFLRNFLAWGAWTPPKGKTAPLPDAVDIGGVALYLNARQRELHRLVETFPQAWQTLQTSGFGRTLADAVKDL